MLQGGRGLTHREDEVRHGRRRRRAGRGTRARGGARPEGVETHTLTHTLTLTLTLTLTPTLTLTLTLAQRGDRTHD